MSAELKGFEGRTVDGRYVLREWLGEGNFGAVFRSEQHAMGVPIRRVAVKLSRRAGMSESTARDLFSDALILAEAMDGMSDTEARAHLVHLYDAGIAEDMGGRAYLAMEYVQGTTLHAQFVSYPRGVPAPLLVKWARQICLALRGLHALVPPLLHRDLKADNVLLGLDRTVRLVDFGLAARLLDVGHAEGIVGTHAAMAPETLLGESVPASDLYSLGVLIYEGLTGRHPFGHLHPPADLPSGLHRDWLFEARAKCRVEPPSLLNNTVPEELDALVMRCLEHSPARRIATADEFLTALDAPRPPKRDLQPDMEEELRHARALNEQGDLDGARAALERLLASRTWPPAERFVLLRDLGQALGELDEAAESARRYKSAWQLLDDRATGLPSRPDMREQRVPLLRAIVRAYTKAGNHYQANRFEELLRREEGRGGR
ncbi:serine/threonine-protein kinase [Actinomadura sp. KC216]|uniref:serine/threonine-protein kinase n=1 Tax=Actinomadura sp. KC216 TaxID=2530370 RepID=UPI0014049C4D|nr:serine/threonine-protein kinase [Actinomadura sp. KC216]